MFIGDALAMPVHWYYNTQALINDYGKVTDYQRPRNPHPDSILWRSSYTPPSGNADIRHDQAQYWGKRDIHYHQFLRAGENTLNLQLARELLLLLGTTATTQPHPGSTGSLAFMTTPGSHTRYLYRRVSQTFFHQLWQRQRTFSMRPDGRKTYWRIQPDAPADHCVFQEPCCMQVKFPCSTLR